MPLNIGIVGAGIVGLAHAWSAVKRGHSVTLFERAPKAQGASIRNFGMIWPIGQSAGTNYQTALHSRQLWLEASSQAKFWCEERGSLHLAYENDEHEILQEFVDRKNETGFECELWNADQTQVKCPAIHRDRLKSAMWSPTELVVDPREVIATLPDWLAEQFNVQLQFNTTIQSIHETTAHDTTGRQWPFDAMVICSGADFETLFPETLQSAGLRKCKLQMMRTVPQPDGWQIGSHLAGGLTLRHYSSFEICSTLPRLKERIAQQNPKLDQWGIHVMASQNRLGEVILGDSHEYDDAIEPFDRLEIDDLMLAELHKLIELPDWTLSARWHGIYAKHPSDVQFVAEPQSGVRIVSATGGAGMTMSFALAEQLWSKW